MARYIDADSLKKCVNDRSTHLLNEWDTLGVLAAIDEQPTADVQEVKHGCWLTSGYDVRTAEGKTVRAYDLMNATCSRCGGMAGIRENIWYPHNIHDLLYPFCPHCGAKMDGKDSDK